MNILLLLFMWVIDVHYTKFKYFLFSMISYWLKNIYILLIKYDKKGVEALHTLTWLFFSQLMHVLLFFIIIRYVYFELFVIIFVLFFKYIFSLVEIEASKTTSTITLVRPEDTPLDTDKNASYTPDIQ